MHEIAIHSCASNWKTHTHDDDIYAGLQLRLSRGAAVVIHNCMAHFGSFSILFGIIPAKIWDENHRSRKNFVWQNFIITGCDLCNV